MHILKSAQYFGRPAILFSSKNSGIQLYYDNISHSRSVVRNYCCVVNSGTSCVAQLPELNSVNKNLKSHADISKFAQDQPDKFWGALGRSRLQWHRAFQSVSACDMQKANFRWFLEGQLNASVNCVDRHFREKPDKTALIWERDEPDQAQRISYRELYHLVCQFANMLKAHNVQKGDRVAIYMPTSPLAVVAMLACTRIGAIHNVVFAGFSADSLAARITDAQAKIVITCDQITRGGKPVELKKTVDSALQKCPGVEKVFVSKRGGSTTSKLASKEIYLEKELERYDKECEPTVLDSEDALFMLYTSGSTGKPKGLIHSTAGYLLYAMITHKLVFDYRENDVFGCLADIGWITGHSYVVYGPLANGGTTVLFESVPTYPNPGRYWETVQRLKINQLYIAPTAIRLLHGHGDDWVRKYDRGSLRVLGSVGEPINHEAWQWYHSVVGENRCTLVDTWWQTETGGICIAPAPADPGSKVKPAIAMRPFYGTQPVLMDDKGKAIQGSGYGALCLKQPWPGMARTIYGDHERYVQTYFSAYPGFYFTGDGASRDEEGFYQITGRMDDVINVSGHRLGTAEIEDVLDEHPAVSESAVVGFPHKIKGEGVFAFISLRDGVATSEKNEQDIVRELRATVKKAIASYAMPDHIVITTMLPKTRSGKIMRRILKKIAAGEGSNLGDVTTLSDPEAVDVLKEAYEKQQKRQAAAV